LGGPACLAALYAAGPEAGNAIELSELVRQLALAGIGRARPDEREVFLIVAKRSLGEELFQKVYGAV
jgi:hypothetical protein